MSSPDIIKMIDTLKEWEALATEAAAEIESLKDSIKCEMTVRGVETLEAGKYTAHYTTVQTTRFDSAAFKKEHGDIYRLYTRQTISRRFCIS